MRRSRKLLYVCASAAVLAGAAVAMSTTPASAEVACNRYGECWHVNGHYNYPPHLSIRIYGDDWREAHRHDRHYHWLRDRDDDDHGYYSRGRWHRFD